MSPKPWNRLLLPGLLLAAVVALGIWIVPNTEWVEIDVPRDATGRAAGDDFYALQRILQGIGAVLVKRDSLSELPPPSATLLLSFWIWNLLPERDRALRAWVEQGGHLVIGDWMILGRGDGGARWIPVVQGKPLVRNEPLSPGTSQADPSKLARDSIATALLGKSCRQVAEPAGITPAYAADSAAGGAGPGLQLCAAGAPLDTKQTPLWALEGDRGIELVRVAVGAGSVTVVPGWQLFHNGPILKGDDALIAVAALQARPGISVWLVSGAGDRGMLAWLWSRAWIALDLALVALVLWLWRGCARFGPLEAAPHAGRRSMIEQIAGTASFLWRHSPGALHQAQLRALDEVATVHLRNYARLDRPDRASAISQATGIEVAAIRQAVNFGDAPSARALPRMLAVLESARRALLERARAPRVAFDPDRADPNHLRREPE